MSWPGPAWSQTTQDTQDTGFVIRYGDVADALAAKRGGMEVASGVRLRPAPPPSSYTQSQKNDYWLGATARALSRCGYYDDGMALQAMAKDAKAFTYGGNRLKGSMMMNCAKVKRLYEKLSAAMAK